MSKPKHTRSFRLQKDVLDKCKELDLNLSVIIEAYLQGLVNEKRCPACHQRLKKKTK